MAYRFNNHNRFAEERDLEPTSQFQEALSDHRQEERERNAAGWWRNLSFVALGIVVALVAMWVMR